MRGSQWVHTAGRHVHRTGGREGKSQRKRGRLQGKRGTRSPSALGEHAEKQTSGEYRGSHGGMEVRQRQRHVEQVNRFKEQVQTYGFNSPKPTDDHVQSRLL